MQSIIRSIVIALVVLLVITVVIQNMSSNAQANATPIPGASPTNVQITRPPVEQPEIVVKSQKLSAGNVIQIAKVNINTPGWVSVHYDTNGKADPKTIGYAAVKKGTSLNVRVPLTNTRLLTIKIWVMLHIDAGKIGTFEYPGADTLAKVPGGGLVMASFQLNR